MDGVRLNDKATLEALGVDKQGLVESITRAYAHQIYVDGFFNGDPHPGLSPSKVWNLCFLLAMETDECRKIACLSSIVIYLFKPFYFLCVIDIFFSIMCKLLWKSP